MINFLKKFTATPAILFTLRLAGVGGKVFSQTGERQDAFHQAHGWNR